MFNERSCSMNDHWLIGSCYWTGNNLRSHPHWRVLRCAFAANINVAQIQLPRTLPRGVGPGASLVDLGEGAKRDAPMFNSQGNASSCRE